MNRLEVNAERLQFILTSASFSGEAEEFAESLTHKLKSGWHRQGARPITYGQKKIEGDMSQVETLLEVSRNQPVIRWSIRVKSRL